MHAAEAVSNYHEPWHVEESFRKSKHDLTAPVFHHQREAIDAHLTVVMAFQAAARYLQDTTGTSIKHTIRTPRPLQDLTINIDGHHLSATPLLTDAANDIITTPSTPPRHTNRHEPGARSAVSVTFGGGRPRDGDQRRERG